MQWSVIKNSRHSTKESRHFSMSPLLNYLHTQLLFLQFAFFKTMSSASSKPPSFWASLLSSICMGRGKLLLWNQSTQVSLNVNITKHYLPDGKWTMTELKDGWAIRYWQRRFILLFETKWPLVHMGYKVICSQ